MNKPELEQNNTHLKQELNNQKDIQESLEARIAAAVGELRQKDNVMLLEYRQALMGQLVNNIAHQWRQPLNTLGLVLQQLPICYGSHDFGLEFLKETTASGMKLVQQMSKTIDSFRDFFRPDEAMVPFKVDQMVTRTLSLIEESLKDQKISVTRNLKGDPMAKGYPNQFSQALLSILMNARDALSVRDVDAAVISLRVFSKKDVSVVTITDNAGGIPEKFLGRLFDPYFTTKGPDKGIGIGLYMSKTVIEKNMGGALTVRNVKGGAEFIIEISSP